MGKRGELDRGRGEWVGMGEKECGESRVGRGRDKEVADGGGDEARWKGWGRVKSNEKGEYGEERELCWGKGEFWGGGREMEGGGGVFSRRYGVLREKYTRKKLE